MIEFPGLNLIAPDGSIIGIITEGRESLGTPGAVLVGPGDRMPEAPGNYILDHALSRSDAVTKLQAVARLVHLRRKGATIALVSHDEALLESCADEIWWIRNGALMARGDPADVLPRYRRHVAEELRASGENHAPRLTPTMRNG